MDEHTACEEAYKRGYTAGYYARTKEETTRCLFNSGVVCDPDRGDCDGCGWSPAVSQERLRRICKTMGIPVPELPPETSSPNKL